MSWLALLCTTPAVLLSIPVLVLFAEILAAVLIGDHGSKQLRPRTGRLAIIVPAHNEGQGPLPTLRDLLGQIRAGDRIVVVADNCTDDTADIARSAGVEVIVRQDRQRIGKGYALDFGVRHLASDAPDLVLFCDADCRLQSGMIDQLAGECEASGRPVQACYLMSRSEETPGQTFAEFAWTVKNLVRPLGLRALNGPCQLVGTGMMFPWQVIRSAPLASASLVEDLQLGIELAIAGAAPKFLPSAVTTSIFPVSHKGADAQRLRWIQGYLGTLMTQVPRMLLCAVWQGDLRLLAMGLDLAVPPLLLLFALALVSWLVAGVGSLFALSPLVALPATLDLFLLLAAVALAWLRFGRATFSLSAVMSVAAAALGKSTIFLQLLRGRKATHWVRTERSTVALPNNGLAVRSGHADVIEPS